MPQRRLQGERRKGDFQPSGPEWWPIASGMSVGEQRACNRIAGQQAAIARDFIARWKQEGGGVYKGEELCNLIKASLGVQPNRYKL